MKLRGILLALLGALILFSILMIFVFKDKKKPLPPKEVLEEPQRVEFHQARTVMVIRQVSVLRGGQKKPLKTGDLLQEEDEIETLQNSAAEIVLENRFRILLRENTRISVKALKTLLAGDDPLEVSYEFDLSRGRIMVQIDPLKASESFQLRTPAMAIGVRGTGFVVKADEDQTVLKVRKGRVQASRNIEISEKLKSQAEILVEEMEQVQIKVRENLETAKILQSGREDLPRIRKEKASAADEDLIYYDRYFALSSDLSGGLLEVVQTQGARVFINDLEMGQGDFSRYLSPGRYALRLETDARIFEAEVEMIAGETHRVVPVFKARALTPREPERKPRLSQ